jgi:hypothetical protein
LAEQFKEEMELGSFTTATQFAQRIDQRIENKFKQLNQTDKHYSATVLAVNTSTGLASIQLHGGTQTIPNVKMRNNVAVAVGDEVEVLAINGSLNNIIIDFNKSMADNTKTGGILTGVLTAYSNTSYSTAQVRNIILSTGDATVGAMNNGDIWIKYV